MVWCGVVDLLQRARAERSTIERRVGQYIECVVLDLFSNLEIGKIQGFLCEPLNHVMTLRGHSW